MANTYIDAINTGNSWWPWRTRGAWRTRETSLTKNKKKKLKKKGAIRSWQTCESQSGGTGTMRGGFYGLVRGSQLG